MTTSQFANLRCVTEATIENGESASNTVDLKGTKLIAIDTDANWDGASITFKVQGVDGALQDYLKMSDGTAVQAVVNAKDKNYGGFPIDFAGYSEIQIISNTTQTSGDTVLKIRSIP